MSLLGTENIIKLLKKFVKKTGRPLKVILVGGLALQYYDKTDRSTRDFDAEVKGDVEELIEFLKAHDVPSDIGEDISGWSVVSMPPNYRRRTRNVYKDNLLSINILAPVDFIVSKLRRFTDEDMEDALFVAKKCGVSPREIETTALKALRNSPKDTALYIFKKNLDLLLKKLSS